MKVIDHVNQAINRYPSLYMFENYEDSTFAVLHHCFIVLGNGLEWAKTGSPKTGGYIVSPRHRKFHGEWIRIKDKPYGKEKCELDPRAFKEDIFYFEEIDKRLSKKGLWLTGKSEGFKVVFESELEKLKKEYKVCDNETEYVSGFHTHCYSLIKKYSSKENPYPNFQKTYSCFWEIEPELIQEDWRLAGIEHLKYWQEYFNDEERVKGYHYFRNPGSLQKFIFEQYKGQPNKYPNWIQAVRNGYDFQEFDGDNFEELAATRWAKELQKTKVFLTETIDRLNI